MDELRRLCAQAQQLHGQLEAVWERVETLALTLAEYKVGDRIEIPALGQTKLGSVIASSYHVDKKAEVSSVDVLAHEIVHGRIPIHFGCQILKPDGTLGFPYVKLAQLIELNTTTTRAGRL